PSTKTLCWLYVAEWLGRTTGAAIQRWHRCSKRCPARASSSTARPCRRTPRWHRRGGGVAPAPAEASSPPAPGSCPHHTRVMEERERSDTGGDCRFCLVTLRRLAQPFAGKRPRRGDTRTRSAPTGRLYAESDLCPMHHRPAVEKLHEAGLDRRRSIMREHDR